MGKGGTGDVGRYLMALIVRSLHGKVKNNVVVKATQYIETPPPPSTKNSGEARAGPETPGQTCVVGLVSSPRFFKDSSCHSCLP